MNKSRHGGLSSPIKRLALVVAAGPASLRSISALLSLKLQSPQSKQGNKGYYITLEIKMCSTVVILCPSCCVAEAFSSCLSLLLGASAQMIVLFRHPYKCPIFLNVAFQEHLDSKSSYFPKHLLGLKEGPIWWPKVEVVHVCAHVYPTGICSGGDLAQISDNLLCRLNVIIHDRMARQR